MLGAALATTTAAASSRNKNVAARTSDARSVCADLACMNDIDVSDGAAAMTDVAAFYGRIGAGKVTPDYCTTSR